MNRVHWSALNILTKCQNNINESKQIDNDSCTREIAVTKNAWRTVMVFQNMNHQDSQCCNYNQRITIKRFIHILIS